MIRTRWELLHPVTGISLGFEWIDREPREPMPPPPHWIAVPVVRILDVDHLVRQEREARA